jgi:hypothetical protein
MKELIEERVFGRRTTKALVEANTRYRNGDESALTEIVEKLQALDFRMSAGVQLEKYS